MQEDIVKFAVILANFIANKNFGPVTQQVPYNHMGATIIDSVLQAGLNYKYVVYPRVQKILQDFHDYTTTCDFIILMQTIPLVELIN